MSKLKDQMQIALKELDEVVLAALQNVYWLAKEDIALIKCGSLAHLRDISVTDQLPKRKDGKHPYANPGRAREFVFSISACIKERIWAEINASPAISILIDESTDVSTSENMVVYAIYLDTTKPKFQVKTTFSGMLHCPNTTAEGITD